MKKAKQRFMIAFIANAAGGKESAIVIWKAEKTRCFKGIDVSKLPVKYFSQLNAWMTGKILDEVLTKLNHHLSSCSPSIVLLMDNAGCHPHELKGKYSNIKILFLPPNTTSQIQPLDLRIIKVHYRKLLLRFVLSKIDQTNDTASQIVKSVSVLTAIRWVAEAWDSVKEETIMKCFTKSGINGSSFSIVSSACENEDPFDDVEDQEELHGLVDQISPSATNCPVEEYIIGEDDVPTCMQYDDDWDNNFFAELGSSQEDSDSLVQEDPDEEEGHFDLEPPPPKITRFQDAISSLEAVQTFLDSKGHSEEATRVASTMNRLAHLHCASLNSARQSTLEEFFSPT